MIDNGLSKEMVFLNVEKLLDEKKKAVIVVSGTPGTGKTTLSKDLSEKYGLLYFDLNEYAKEEGFSLGVDEKQDTHIIDTEKLFERIEEALTFYKDGKKTDIEQFNGIDKYNGIIIDSHFAHDILKECVDICIIARTDLKELKRRLEKRGYSKEKIEENVDSEIFEICLTEAIENEHRIIIYKN